MKNKNNTTNKLSYILNQGLLECREEYEELLHIHNEEFDRQQNTLAMVASCSSVSPSVLACMGLLHVNVTAEGYPGQRYHAGCEYMDKLENLTIDNAKKIFKAQYANVQPHSASTANEIVLYYFLNPGDTILGLSLNSGGHLSHGANVSFSGTHFNSIKYGLDENYQIDYDEVMKLAMKHRPKLIICGTTAYSREIDFIKFREIADKVDALLLADISHIAGLVVAGLHPSPIDVAHITTTCTHKQLFGPRGGLILLGKDSKKFIQRGNQKKTLEEHMQKAVFPFFQGAPMMNMIAAKAMTFKLASNDSFKEIMKNIIKNSRLLANYFISCGMKVVSNGTDTHIVLLDLSSNPINGDTAEKALEMCGIIVNKNSVPGINTFKASREPQGIRIGTNSISQRNLNEQAVLECARLIVDVINNTILHDGKVIIEEGCKKKTLEKVNEICKKFPLASYT